MNTREQVELDTILTELRGEIAGLKSRVAQLEDAQSRGKTGEWEVTYVKRGTNIITAAHLVYNMDEAYTLIENAPAGVSIEVTPMSKEDMEAK